MVIDVRPTTPTTGTAIVRMAAECPGCRRQVLAAALTTCPQCGERRCPACHSAGIVPVCYRCLDLYWGACGMID